MKFIFKCSLFSSWLTHILFLFHSIYQYYSYKQTHPHSLYRSLYRSFSHSSKQTHTHTHPHPPTHTHPCTHMHTHAHMHTCTHPPTHSLSNFHKNFFQFCFCCCWHPIMVLMDVANRIHLTPPLCHPPTRFREKSNKKLSKLGQVFQLLSKELVTGSVLQLAVAVIGSICTYIGQ